LGKSDDIFAITQSISTRLEKHYEYLEKTNVRLTKQVMEKYIQIYWEFSGLFEKYLRIIIGLLYMLDNGTKPEYAALRKIPLTVNLKEIQKRDEYSVLVKPFDKVIRNAISHKSYLFDVEEKIEFSDFKEKISLSYHDFMKKVRELSSLIWVFPQINIMVYLNEVLTAEKMSNQLSINF